MEKLSSSQLKLLEFLYKCQEKKLPIPSFREMAQYMKYSAVGSIQDIVSALRKKGYLQQSKPRGARTIQITESARKIFNKGQQNEQLEALGMFMVPCLGQVPAGNPVEAVEEKIGELAVSTRLFRSRSIKPSQLFALKAKGESMVLAGIMDGDWLVVRSRKGVDQGTIVVAKLNDGSATVKRLMKDAKKGWYLKPENPKFKPTFASQQPFEVIGDVVALQRPL